MCVCVCVLIYNIYKKANVGALHDRTKFLHNKLSEAEHFIHDPTYSGRFHTRLLSTLHRDRYIWAGLEEFFFLFVCCSNIDLFFFIILLLH